MTIVIGGPLTATTSRNIRNVTASGTLLTTDDIVIVNSNSGNINVTLPSSAIGLDITVKRQGAGIVTVIPAPGDNVDTDAEGVILSVDNASITVTAMDATRWNVVSAYPAMIGGSPTSPSNTITTSSRYNRSRYATGGVRMFGHSFTPKAQRNKLRYTNPLSVWNRRLREDETLDPNSAELVQRLMNQIDNPAINGGNATWVNTQSSTTPIYEVNGNSVTKILVTDTDGYLNQIDRTDKWQNTALCPWLSGIRSNDAEVDSGTYKDRHLSLVDVDNDTLWDFFQVRREGADLTNNPHNYPSIRADHGGRALTLSSFDGFFADPVGSTATGAPILAGTVRLIEAQNRVIPHALRCALMSISTVFRAPATRRDASPTNAGGAGNIIEEGTIFRLPYDFDFAGWKAGTVAAVPGGTPPGISRGMSIVADLMMVAAREYGIICTDGNSSNVTLYLEDNRPASASYAVRNTSDAGGVGNGESWYTLKTPAAGGARHEDYDLVKKDRFPWAWLQVLTARPALYGS